MTTTRDLAEIETNILHYIETMTREEKLQLCTGFGAWSTTPLPRLDIPAIRMSDGTNGVRFMHESKETGPIDLTQNALNSSFDSASALSKTEIATSFPSGSTIACAWDTELIKKTAHAIAQECNAQGINLLLGPGINIRRHPLTARNFEYYSEDPYLTGRLGSAMVQGLAERGIGSTIKHFACHNNDTNRTRVDSIVDERTLHEIYLAAFEYIVRTDQPIAVMTSYNKINGVESSANPSLLTTLLRKEWGFTGMVVSDWGAVNNPKASTEAGLDLQMPQCDSSTSYLQQLMEEGTLDEQFINKRVEHILNAVFKLKAMGKTPTPLNLKTNHALSCQAAGESMVLLKNEGQILPLTKKKLAVVGALAQEPLYQGTGCAIVHTESIDIPYSCIKNRLASDKSSTFSPGYTFTGVEEKTLEDQACALTKDADVAIVFVGQFLPTESDRFNRTSMALEPSHTHLLERIITTGTPVVVVVQSGDVVEMPWLESVEAVLFAGFAGEGGGEAIAQILFGEVNPSGKLPVTIPKKLQDTPAYTTFPGDGFNLVMGEGPFVGYRYYDYRSKDPLFPFGFGLSYTTFAYQQVKLSKKRLVLPDTVELTLEVTNTGTRQGKEVVQLYVGQQNSALPRPIRELKGFTKVDLEIGQTKTVTFTLSERDFAYFDSNRNAWVVDSDVFTLEIGSSSRSLEIQVELEVQGRRKPPRALHSGSGFSEIFEHPISTTLLFDFLVQKGLVKESDVGDQLVKAFSQTFWGLSSYLDMNTKGKVSLEEVEKLMQTMNEKMGVDTVQ